MTGASVYRHRFRLLPGTSCSTTSLSAPIDGPRSFGDGPVVIIAGAQRKTPDAMQAWARALLGARSRRHPRVRPQQHEEASRSSCRKGRGAEGPWPSMLPRDSRCLLDWKGKVYPAVGLSAGRRGVGWGVRALPASRLGTGEPAMSHDSPLCDEVVGLPLPLRDPGAKGAN